MSLKKEISKSMNCDKLYLRKGSSSMGLSWMWLWLLWLVEWDEDEISGSNE
jgi:hypothetical protein